MEENNSLKNSDSDDMDVGEGEGAAVPVRSITTQSAPYSPAVSATGDNADPPRRKIHQSRTEKSIRSIIPILNKDTMSLNTYDADLILNKKVQQQAFSGHRMRNSRSPDLGKLLSHRSLNISIEKSRHSTPRIHHGSLDNRSEQLKLGIEKRFGRFKEEIKQKEIKECSFSPNLRRFKGRPPVSPRRFCERLAENAEKKFRSPVKVAEQPKFQPEICEKSKKIAEKIAGKEPRYEALHNNYKSKSSKDLAFAKVDQAEVVSTVITVVEPEKPEPFHPALNQRSKNLLRTSPFGEEFARAKQKKISKPALVTMCTSPRSEKVLIDKFIREFNELVDEDTPYISYAHLNEILRSMSFVLGSSKHLESEKETAIKLWRQLEREEKIEKDQLLMFLLAIMRYKPHLFYKNSMNLIAQEDSDRIHQRFLLFYENRLSVKNKSTINKSYKHTYDFPFKPEINENSKIILESMNEDSNKKKELIGEKWTISSKKAEKIKEGYIKERELHCTFKPQITSKFNKTLSAKETGKETLAKEYLSIITESFDRNEALYSLASVKDKLKKSNSFKTAPTEDETVECTFTPKLINRPKDVGSPRILGSEKAIQRLSKAREEKNVLKTVVEKGFPYQGAKNLPKTTQGETKEKLQKTGEIKDPEKEKRIKEWEMKKLKDLKTQREKERIKQEIKEKQNSEAELQRLQDLEEKRIQRLEKIKISKEKQNSRKKRPKNDREFFSFVPDKREKRLDANLNFKSADNLLEDSNEIHKVTTGLLSDSETDIIEKVSQIEVSERSEIPSDKDCGESNLCEVNPEEKKNEKAFEEVNLQNYETEALKINTENEFKEPVEESGVRYAQAEFYVRDENLRMEVSSDHIKKNVEPCEVEIQSKVVSGLAKNELAELESSNSYNEKSLNLACPELSSFTSLKPDLDHVEAIVINPISSTEAHVIVNEPKDLCNLEDTYSLIDSLKEKATKQINEEHKDEIEHESLAEIEVRAEDIHSNQEEISENALKITESNSENPPEPPILSHKDIKTSEEGRNELNESSPNPDNEAIVNNPDSLESDRNLS